MWMCQTRRCLALAQKSLAEAPIFRKIAPDDLDCDLAAKGVALVGSIHFGHATSADALKQVIIAKLGAFKSGHETDYSCLVCPLLRLLPGAPLGRRRRQDGLVVYRRRRILAGGTDILERPGRQGRLAPCWLGGLRRRWPTRRRWRYGRLRLPRSLPPRRLIFAVLDRLALKRRLGAAAIYRQPDGKSCQQEDADNNDGNSKNKKRLVHFSPPGAVGCSRTLVL